MPKNSDLQIRSLLEGIRIRLGLENKESTPEKNDVHIGSLLEGIRFRLGLENKESTLDLRHDSPSTPPEMLVAAPDPVVLFTEALERFQSTMKTGLDELRTEIHEFKDALHEDCDEMIQKIMKVESCSNLVSDMETEEIPEVKSGGESALISTEASLKQSELSQHPISNPTETLESLVHVQVPNYNLEPSLQFHKKSLVFRDEYYADFGLGGFAFCVEETESNMELDCFTQPHVSISASESGHRDIMFEEFETLITIEVPQQVLSEKLVHKVESLIGVSSEDFIEAELVQEMNSPVVAETYVKSCNSQPYTNNDGLVIAAISNADNDDFIKAVAVSRRVLCVHKPLRVHSKKKTTKRSKSWHFKYKSLLTGHISVLLKTVWSYWDMVMPRVKQRKVDCGKLKAILISSQTFEAEANDDVLGRRTRTTTVRKDRELMRVEDHTNWQFSPLTLCFLQHHIAVIHYELIGPIDWVSFRVEQLFHDGPMENLIPFERCRILQQFDMSQFMLKPRVCKTGENCNLLLINSRLISSIVCWKEYLSTWQVLNNQRFLKSRRFKFKAKAQPRELVHDTLCLKESGYINVDILKDAKLEHSLSPFIILVVNLRHCGLFQHLATVLKGNFMTHQVFTRFFSWGTISRVVFELLSSSVSRVWDPGRAVAEAIC